jgi:hypothetical protein
MGCFDILKFTVEVGILRNVPCEVDLIYGNMNNNTGN